MNGFLQWCRERVTISSTILGGTPTLGGTRLAIENLVSLLRAGESRERIVAEYPYVTDEDLAHVQALADLTALRCIEDDGLYAVRSRGKWAVESSLSQVSQPWPRGEGPTLVEALAAYDRAVKP